jgi:prepilin-type N-terminal cleavage/methylation domain-containing protein
MTFALHNNPLHKHYTLHITQSMKREDKAFTLVELLIASAIFLVVISTVYSAFHSGIFGYRNIEETINIYQAARQILERIDLDLRNAVLYSEQDAKFAGEKLKVSFLSIVDTFSSENKIVQDYAFVSYSLKENKLLRLCRKNKEALNEKVEKEPDEMSPDIEAISFSYADIDRADGSLKFKDSWALEDAPDEKGRLPVEVKVKITLKNKKNEDFERTIFLPQAKVE